MPILNSALGVENAVAIAVASAQVVALTVVLEDYTADLGAVKTPEGSESLYARSRLVNAANATRVQAIDSVYSDVADMEGLKRWALAAYWDFKVWGACTRCRSQLSTRPSRPRRPKSKRQ